MYRMLSVSVLLFTIELYLW